MVIRAGDRRWTAGCWLCRLGERFERDGVAERLELTDRTCFGLRWFAHGVVVGPEFTVERAVGGNQWNANRLWLTHVSGGVAVGLLGRLGVVVAGRGRCGAGSGRASR